MKKIGLTVVAAVLSLSVVAFAAQQDRTRGERPSSRSKTDQPQGERTSPEGQAVRGDQARSPKTLADQIAQLKQEHQAAINELQEIRKLANEEKAPKTAGALDKLIARRNQEFQKRIGPLQQRLDRLQGQAKGGDKAKTTGDKRKSKTKEQ